MKNLTALILFVILMVGCSPVTVSTLPPATSQATMTSSPIPSTATLTPSPLPPTDTPEATLTPKPQAFHFSLPASACWINSKINVHEGQAVLIRAAGEVNTWGGRAGSSSKPVGQKGICGAVQCPLQGMGYGALIARVEDLPPFFVGTMHTFTPAKDGQLYFTVNDWQCEDNSGTFEIMVTFP